MWRLRSAMIPPDLDPVGRRNLLVSWFALPAAAVLSVLLGAVMMLAFGANPITGYHALVDRRLRRQLRARPDRGRRPPRFCSSPSGSASPSAPTCFNIGGEGQIAMGGLAGTATALALPNLPSVVLIPLVLLAGAAGGGVWGAIPGAFKAYFNVNEILSTIMLNLVAVQVMNYLLAGPDGRQDAGFAIGGLIPQTRLLSRNSWLPILIPGTQLHLGRADRGARGRRRVRPAVAHELRLPHPGGRAVA